MSMPQDPQDATPTQAHEPVGMTQPTVQLPAAEHPLPSGDAGAPAYEPAPYGTPYQAAPAPLTTPQGTTLGQTNTFAFLSIILAFISPIAGIVFGHMGLSQIKRTGDAGRGIALTGLIISYAWFAFLAIFLVLYIGFIVMIVGFAADSVPGYSY